MKFTYYGHACFGIETMGMNLLIDPFISGNELAKDIDIHSIKADYILVSHGHGDHIADAIDIALRTNATIIGGVEVINWLQKKGAAKVHEMNFGTYHFPFGTLHFVPAAHSSSMPDGTYGGNPGGFIIQNKENNIYYSGDTSLTAELSMIPHYGKLDFAILPIGGNYTMDAERAAIAATMIQCDNIIGVHYDTFPPIKIDLELAKSVFKMANKKLFLPNIGETIDL
jgi:L-ascorbate metabolism protein UlaG (beta-lactamase superfamily)